jgi:hypothetical protein
LSTIPGISQLSAQVIVSEFFDFRSQRALHYIHNAIDGLRST